MDIISIGEELFVSHMLRKVLIFIKASVYRVLLSYFSFWKKKYRKQEHERWTETWEKLEERV